MPIIQIKISDSTELIRKHFLCCEKRSELYLDQVAKRSAIKDAVDKGWLEPVVTGETMEFYITDAGKKLV